MPDSKRELCVSIVQREEGGLADIPGDSGGLTNYGITQHTYDTYRSRNGLVAQSVRFIQQHEVEEVYDVWWKVAQVDLLSWPISLVHFDHAFNAFDAFNGNPRNVARLLQRALNVDDDGVLGPISLAAINLANRSIYSATLVAERYLLERVFFYDTLDEHDPIKTKFLTEFWLKRLKHLYHDIDKAQNLSSIIEAEA